MNIEQFVKQFEEHTHEDKKDNLRSELSSLKEGIEELMKELDFGGVKSMERKLAKFGLEERVAKINKLTGNLESEVEMLRHLETLERLNEEEYTGFQDCNGRDINVGDRVMDIEITDRVIGKIIKEEDDYYMLPHEDLDKMILDENLAKDLWVIES